MKKFFWPALCALAFVALGAMYVLRVFGPVYEVAPGAAIRHDDLSYRVTGVTRGRLDASRDRYVVVLVVENRARRVGYRWRDDIAYVRDGRGPRYAPVTRGTFTLAAGARRTATLQFDLPATARRPLLRFWDGVYAGDIFNAAAYAKAGVLLPARAGHH